ncbi:MAG: NAD(P)H-dependent oxidoreductase [Deltaproteobacteria bacterium]|nr:NAD(P)H-dependent oxidoreductase [Deltaproteobacteria bacterium]NND30248.1 NAD(P)H oxidoreductase [Myxococcales bacterium]MBT8465819.1 NAD(P)H-dependent oxidoreductase [Deltaproteobacteria bacterium]MBT8481033.1 NAD(P)H-dependent oxidoreductase [Deltaproteobacteria bacterium]NNK07642.1 NAD(P)H oxidoreductase [Myxococcales bacterium]
MGGRRRVLVLFAHPALETSRVNRVLIRGLEGIDGVTVHDLYEEYPDFDIDVATEQQLLLEHDVIVLHHPFYWYSTPALIKQWEDLVLTHGWAYGSGGDALHGKWMMSAITTGGGKSAYQPGGHNRFTVSQLLRPIEQTARLCGMDYLSPFVVYGTLDMHAEAIRAHAVSYRRRIETVRDGALDPLSSHQQLGPESAVDDVMKG